MPRLVHRNPQYRRHRSSGQAVVTIDGKDHYLGPYGTKASRAEYDRLIGEWLAGGRRLRVAACDLQVVELIRAFWRHAQVYYRKADGSRSSEVKNFRDSLRPLKRLYANTPVAEFGPLKLKALREEMIRRGWCRTHINRQVARIKHVFKWGTENEMVPAEVFHALQAVGGLKAGRSEAKESKPVQPVPEDRVQAVLPYVSRQVRAMIELQLIAGMRPGEACAMRGCDLDTTGNLWVYRPSQHKTLHHGHRREIYLGPKAQEIIRLFLKTDLTAYLFSPADADAERRAKMHAERKTPLPCGNVPGSNVRRTPRKKPGGRYTVESYCRAIHKACERAFGIPADYWPTKGEKPAADDTPEQAKAKTDVRAAKSKKRAEWHARFTWHPHQLRHSAATWLRKRYGLEAAQVILGHKTLSVTEVYAEKNVAAAQRIMGEVG